MNDLLLADLIFLFHCIVILFILLAPFSNIPAILILHITFCVCLFIHWYSNSNICSLSLIEANLRGLEYREDTFTHKFIAPIYDISVTEWSNTVWVITFVLLCISLYKLWNNDIVKNAWKCYKESKPQDSLSKSFTNVVKCFTPLFVIKS